MRTHIGITLAFTVAGCATGTNDPVQISDNLYLIGGQGKFTEQSGSVVKARFFQKANTFCNSKGLKLVPVKDPSQARQSLCQEAATMEWRMRFHGVIRSRGECHTGTA